MLYFLNLRMEMGLKPICLIIYQILVSKDFTVREIEQLISL
ncbi:hypothetical protein CWATWH8502_1841 [Crocosphaera watsonii WH 8502]|uniref:Uncharacterized protein n=2 Tax=Crocosphaera watsonii TaxID=263511 RepID=T2J7D6_CROWT|nr:hypothetical protein CWATWH8502_1841 [Crocosphaera watsonii WH 8502]CCQ61788.1 hypothetical protein CWATWH0401_3399 [Crocosphaera watsonii WH 0401]